MRKGGHSTFESGYISLPSEDKLNVSAFPVLIRHLPAFAEPFGDLERREAFFAGDLDRRAAFGGIAATPATAGS